MNSKETPTIFGFSRNFVLFVGIFTFTALIGPLFLNKIGHWQERVKKCQDARRRVEKAGGWENLKTASLFFFTNAQLENGSDEMYYWRGERRTTNPLPRALDLLQPWRIQCRRDSNNFPILCLQLYGIHRTGMYSEPYYSVWVVCTNVSTNYVPQIMGVGRQCLIEKKGDSIFEVRQSN